MKFTKVRRHTRRTSRSVTTVRKHARKCNPSKLVDHFRRRYAIQSGVKVQEGSYSDAEDTSMAMTESLVGKDGVPKHHKIHVKSKKIVESGEDVATILHHETAHILVREKKITKLAEYRSLMDAVRSTTTFKNLSGDYAKDTEELFARAYSQVCTGDTTSNDYLFTAKEVRKFKPLMEKLLAKVTGNKLSK